MPTVAVLNQKGGVGKTTVVLGLAAAAQRRGDATLVVDLDPQGSAGWALGVEADDDHLRCSIKAHAFFPTGSAAGNAPAAAG